MSREPGRSPHVLRLCSVFEPRRGEAGPAAARFDPVGGMQNHTAALSRALDRLGVPQTVVTSRLGGARGRDPLGEHGEVRRVGVRLARLRQLWALAALLAVLRPGRRIGVVHAHQGEDLALLPLAALAARVHRCPLVVTVHCSVRHTLTGGSPRARLLRTLGGRLERRFLRRADAVIVLAERTRRLLTADGVGRVHHVPSGFEPGLFAAPVEDPFPDVPHPRIGYVGRLAAQKRPDLVVRAAGLLTAPAHVVVVGDGPEAGHVRRLAAASPARIALHPFVEHHEVPAVLAALDVLVLPSAYEELGSVLVEAMAAGLPVVATRVGGIPEVVEDGVTGLLVPPGDPAALAAALDRVLTEPGLAARFAAAARDRSADWSWDGLARRVAGLYGAGEHDREATPA